MTFIKKQSVAFNILNNVGEDSTAEYIEKGKRGQIGEIRTWSDGKYRKTASGWEPVKESLQASSEEKEYDSLFLKLESKLGRGVSDVVECKSEKDLKELLHDTHNLKYSDEQVSQIFSMSKKLKSDSNFKVNGQTYKQIVGEDSKEKEPEVIEKGGKKYKLQSNGKYLEVSELGMTKEQHRFKEATHNTMKTKVQHYAVHHEETEEKKHRDLANKLSDKEFTKEELKGDKKEDSYIVDNVNNGEIINSLFKEWSSIKTSEQHEKWAKRVANTKFGTYKDKTILNVIGNFNPKFRNEIVKNDFLNEVKRAYDSYEQKTVESTKEDESLKEERKESDLDTFLVKMKKRVIDNHDNSPWEFPGSIKSATEKFANQFNLPVSDIGKLTEEGVLVISQEDKGTNRGGMFTSVKFDVNKLKSKTGYKKS